MVAARSKSERKQIEKAGNRRRGAEVGKPARHHVSGARSLVRACRHRGQLTRDRAAFPARGLNNANLLSRRFLAAARHLWHSAFRWQGFGGARERRGHVAGGGQQSSVVHFERLDGDGVDCAAHWTSGPCPPLRLQVIQAMDLLIWRIGSGVSFGHSRGQCAPYNRASDHVIVVSSGA
jgi:hypothetical protein